jgi:hypothetical protein
VKNWRRRRDRGSRSLLDRPTWGLKIAAVQRTEPGETDDHVTPITFKGKSYGRVRGLLIYLFVRAALVIFAYEMSFIPPGWLKREGCQLSP